MKIFSNSNRPIQTFEDQVREIFEKVMCINEDAEPENQVSVEFHFATKTIYITKGRPTKDWNMTCYHFLNGRNNMEYIKLRQTLQEWEKEIHAKNLNDTYDQLQSESESEFANKFKELAAEQSDI